MNQYRCIENLIESETYEKSLDDIKKSKNLVLNTYNIFAVLSKYCEDVYSQNLDKYMIKYSLEPEFNFNKLNLLAKTAKSWLRYLFES